MTDAFLIGGLALVVLGVYLTFGIGPACMVGGVVLFLAGGKSVRK